MHRHGLALSAGLALTAGSATDKTGGAGSASPPAWCEGPTAHLWDPVNAEEVQLFSDGLLEVDGALFDATHRNMTFLETWIEDGVPEALDATGPR